MATRLLFLSELARELGLAESTVRQLADRFLEPTARAGAMRMYTEADIERLRSIIATRPRLARRLAAREADGE